MNTIKILVAIILGICFLIGFCYVLFKIRESVCDQCPFKNKCIQNQLNEDYTPECQKHYLSHDNSRLNQWP